MQWTRGGAATAERSGVSPEERKTNAQTWLDRIASPPPTYSRAMLRWYNRAMHNPGDYTDPVILERLEEIAGLVAGLWMLRHSLDPEATDGSFAKTDDAIRSLEGQRAGLEMVMQARATQARIRNSQRAPRTSAPGSEPSSSTAAPEWDPFADQ